MQNYKQSVGFLSSLFMEEYLHNPINSLEYISIKSKKKDSINRKIDKESNINKAFVINFTYNINEFFEKQNIADLKKKNDIIDSISHNIQDTWVSKNEDQLLIDFIGVVNQVKLGINQDLIKSNPVEVEKSNNVENVDLLGLEDDGSKSFQDFESFNNPGFDVQGNKIRPKSSPNTRYERM